MTSAYGFALAYNAPRFFEWLFVASEDEGEDSSSLLGYILEDTSLGADSDYTLYYLKLSQLLVMEMVPFCILSITSHLIIRRIRLLQFAKNAITIVRIIMYVQYAM